MLRSFLGLGLLLAGLGFLATRYNHPTYTVEMSGHDTTWVGNYAHMRISVIPKQGWKLSKEAPTKIVLNHTDNVKLSKKDLRVSNVKWDKSGAAHFDIVVTGVTAGVASIEAEMNLFICNPKTCKRETLRMTRNIVVKP